MMENSIFDQLLDVAKRNYIKCDPEVDIYKFLDDYKYIIKTTPSLKNDLENFVIELAKACPSNASSDELKTYIEL